MALSGVTSRSIVSTTSASPTESSGPQVGDHEEKPVHDKFKPEPNSDGENSAVSDVNETTNLEEFPLVNNGTGTNEESEEDDALALFSLLVKRAVDEEIAGDSEEDESETNSVDEDNFSFSDLPKLFKPLIDTFSDESRSEAPSKDDFLSWFPSLKELLEPSKPRGTAATNSTPRSGRRSSFSAASEPSQPEILPSSQPDAFIAAIPTTTRPPITTPKYPVPSSKHPVTIDPTGDNDDDDDDDDSEVDF